MNLLIRHADLPGPAEGRRFLGADHGDLPISFFMVDVPRARAPHSTVIPTRRSSSWKPAKPTS